MTDCLEGPWAVFRPETSFRTSDVSLDVDGLPSFSGHVVWVRRVRNLRRNVDCRERIGETVKNRMRIRAWETCFKKIVVCEAPEQAINNLSAVALGICDCSL